MKVHVTENSAVMFWGLSDEDDKKYFERNAGKISWNERMIVSY